MKQRYIWANLLQLGSNLWSDRPLDPATPYGSGTADYLRFDEGLWKTLTEHMHDIGMNMVVIDLAEGLIYPSHPELAVKGSWTPKKLRTELARLRRMGLEPVPKLNFSACHDIWMGEYARMVSTETYHRVVEDLIRDVCAIFDHPRLFHIGMDEETAVVQRKMEYAVARQGELWFSDLARIAGAVVKHGSRPWSWGDPSWGNPAFLTRVSTSIVQSNWYYWKDVREVEAKLDDPAFKVKPGIPDWAGQNHPAELKSFLDFDRVGFDQIPCATTWNSDENMEQVVAFCIRRLAPERLKGFLLTPWKCTWNEPTAVKKHMAFFPLVEKLIRTYDVKPA